MGLGKLQERIEKLIELKKDKERLDFLQTLLEQGTYTKRVILRNSSTGRGFRLHETSKPGSFMSVRDAIDNIINSKPIL